MMKLRINPVVAEDLKDIKEYIAEDNEEMAVRTIREIYAQIENILCTIIIKELRPKDKDK